MDINLLNSFLFHPRQSTQSLSKNDILVNIDSKTKISIRLHLIKSSYPTILFFHGNGEIGSEYDDIANIYNQHNINFIIADFRGYGFSNGTPTIKNTISDSHIILNYILQYLTKKSYSNKLHLMGRSLGSASVLELSKRYPKDFHSIIIESGFYNEKPIMELFNITLDKKNGFLNDEKIKNYSGPLLIIHAEKDHIIPFNQAKLLYNSCLSKNKLILPISNANHNNILSINPQKYFQGIINFINQ